MPLSNSSIILDLLYPRICFGCGRQGRYMCPACRHRLVFRSAQKPLNQRLEGRLSVFRYKDAIKDLINSLKFEFTTDVVEELAGLIASEFPSRYPNIQKYWQDNKFILVPIPLHPSRENWRGFNQSTLITQSLSEKLHLSFNSDILIRTKNSPPQTSLRDKRLRRRNLSSSFKLLSDKLSNDKFILVDDVYTTGSTILSAASVFPAGAKLWALTLA